MKRAVAAIGLAALVACGRHEMGSPGAVTVTFVGWGAPEERAFVRQAIDALEARDPNINVVYTQIPGVGYDYLNKLRLMLVANRAPDVFYVPDGAFAELVRAGTLLDLDPLLAQSDVDLSAMWPTAVERYRWDGQRLHQGALYALPKDLGPMALYYDKAILQRRGVAPPDPRVPMTWDEAVAMWRALTYDERGVHHYGLTAFPYEAAVWSSGKDVLSADRRSWLLTDPVAEQAVQWCADLANVEGVAPSPARVTVTTELFEAGIAATHIDGRWMVPRFRTLPFDWDVAPIPVPREGAPSIARSGSVGFAIGKHTKHPREAFELVKWLAGPEGQAILVRSGLQLPNQRATASTDLYLQRDRRPAHAEVFVAAAETSRPAPQTETLGTFWFDVYSIFSEPVWRGEKPANEVFPVIKPRIDQALR